MLISEACWDSYENITDTLNYFLDVDQDYLVLGNPFQTYYNDVKYEIHFVFSKEIQKGTEVVFTNITISDFKKIIELNGGSKKWYSGKIKPLQLFADYKEYITETDRRMVPNVSVAVLDFLQMFSDSFTKIDNPMECKELISFERPILIYAQSKKNKNSRYEYFEYYGWDDDDEYFIKRRGITTGVKYGDISSIPLIGYFVGSYQPYGGEYVQNDYWEDYEL